MVCLASMETDKLVASCVALTVFAALGGHYTTHFKCNSVQNQPGLKSLRIINGI